ncbi:MAG: MmcQ/YjbR family DNA-binding protein [Erysipelotrichales bacterium]|nr:MmcQ/YjbR family DNA-binding protein [Erysipelotrichales bacterium]
MRNAIEVIFKNKKMNPSKLIGYGFELKNLNYVYHKVLSDYDFELIVEITENGEVSTKMIDLSTNELYTLHLIDNAVGNFVGQIRNSYENILTEIAKKCFDDNIYKTMQSQSIISYVNDKYGDELEFLWEKFPDTSVLRRKDNKKWYGVLMTVSKSKLGIDSDEIVEIIDVRAKTEDLPFIIDNKKYFPGYHMNKKHWITIILDDYNFCEDIFSLVDKSYNLANK